MMTSHVTVVWLSFRHRLLVMGCLVRQILTSGEPSRLTTFSRCLRLRRAQLGFLAPDWWFLLVALGSLRDNLRQAHFTFGIPCLNVETINSPSSSAFCHSLYKYVSSLFENRTNSGRLGLMLGYVPGLCCVVTSI